MEVDKVVISKKGFTLTELIAVIVVLSLLISISTVVFINVRKNVLKKARNSETTWTRHCKIRR